jgi:Fic family protein
VLRTDSLRITPEILSLISRIDEFKGAWRALGTLAPDRLAALRRVATIESIGSSTRIEGSKLSDREVARLLSNLEIKPFDTRDEQEVAGYAEVMDQVFSSWQDIPFTENHIKQLHQMLLRYSDNDTRHRGNSRPTRTASPPSMKTVLRSALCFRQSPRSTRPPDVGAGGLGESGA